jgi:hypothetical protein
LAKSEHYFDLTFDSAGRAKRVRLLRPKEFCERVVETKLSTALPKTFGEKKRGLFLPFAGSAINLIGFGEYRVVGHYECSSDEPVQSYLRGQPKLWVGKIASPPTVVKLTAASSRKPLGQQP